MNTEIHVAPDQDAIERNKFVEKEGERIRQELVDFVTRNGIVSLHIDTPEHVVEIRIVRLPPFRKAVLTLWGSIWVRDDRVEQSARPSAQGEETK